MAQTRFLVTTTALFALSWLHMSLSQENTTDNSTTTSTNTTEGPTTSNTTSTSTTSSTNTTTGTSTNTTTTTTLFSGAATGAIVNYTDPHGNPVVKIPVSRSALDNMRVGDTVSLSNPVDGYTETGFTIVAFEGRRLAATAGAVLITPIPTCMSCLGSAPVMTVTSAGAGSYGSAGNDPVAFYGKESREFWLPVGVLTPIIQTRHMQLLASTFVGSPREQWMDRIVITNADGFRLADIRIKKDIASFNRSKSHKANAQAFETLDVTLGMSQAPMTSMPPDLPGQNKKWFGRMDISLMFERLNRVFNWLPFHVDQTTIGGARREAVIITTPDTRFLIISSPATEYAGDFSYLAVRYAHLDIHILDMQNRASIRGLLPELWGLKKMSNRTKELTCPPWSKDAPATPPKGVDVDAEWNRIFQI